MRIEYRRDGTKQARTGFAKITARETEFLKSTLQRLLCEICEHAAINDKVWQTAQQPDQEFWGRGRYFGSWLPATMISVLAGSIDKLGRGDLTDAQVEQVNKIFQVVKEFNSQDLLRVKIPEITLESRDTDTLTPMEELRNRLFDHE